MNIDQGKLTKVQESAGWLKQAENYYRWGQYEIADSCVTRARAALEDGCFRRKVIPGFSRNEQPDVIRIVADNQLGFAIINTSDFDETIHELYVEPSLRATGKRSK